MKSIEKQLLTRLLIGQGILWLLASIVVWHSERTRLYSEFDGELRHMGGGIRMHLRDKNIDKEIESRWPGFLSSENSGFVQAWNKDGSIWLKSKNLGDDELVLPFDPNSPPDSDLPMQMTMVNFQGSKGERFRGALSPIRTPPRMPRRPHRSPQERPPDGGVLLVAKSREVLERNLLLLGIGVVALGALASAFTALLVRTSVRQGLAPLFEMGNQASAIDVQNLETRFTSESIPSELEPISKTLNDLLERIEAGFRRERRFNSDSAHELRTPVAEIKSLAALMVKWPEESTPERHLDILKTASHMERVIESLMNLAQWDSESEPLQIETIAVESVLDEYRDKYVDQIKDKQIRLTFSGENQTVEADPTLFNLIISNLLSNAVTYTPENGIVKVTIGDTQPEILAVSNSVEDLNPEEIQHYAERFWRADGVRTGDTHCGLGLSIVSACVDRLGWKMKISLDDSGNMLTFQLSR